MRVEAMIEAMIEADSSGDRQPESRTLEVDAATYEEAKAQMEAQVPEGYKMLWLRVPDRA